MKKMRTVCAAGAAAMCALAASAGEMARTDYEAFVRGVESIPPVLKLNHLEDYSTNVLDFALGNALELTRGGRLWLNWIAGGDGAVSFTAGNWSDDGGNTFTDVNFVIDSHDGTVTDRTNIIGCYWTDPDGILHCFTDQSLFHFDCRAGIWEMTCANPDDAKPVWSKWRRIANGHLMNKPIVLKNGDWAFSAYLMNGRAPHGTRAPKIAGGEQAFPELEAERGTVCYVSSDRGKTWQKRGTAKFPGCDWQESQLLEKKDGSLVVFARVKVEKGCMMASESTDGGFTWTPSHAIATMDNPNARFQVMRLKSGRVLFVCHGKPADGGKDGQNRSRLTAYLSEDDCATWKGGLLLDEGCGSYPDACLGPDGTIYVAHDHGRKKEAEIWVHRFTEEDVLAGKVVSPKGRLGIVAYRGMGSSFNAKRFHKKHAKKKGRGRK